MSIVRRRTAAVAVLFALAATSLALPERPAAAAAGDPLRERGVVTRVVDGDTVDVRVDGRTTEVRVRLTGIQAFEAGQCGAAMATSRLRQLVEGKRVELRARVASSSSLGRPLRSVHLPLASGGTADVNRLLLLEGMGLWFPLDPEYTGNVDYHVAATHARLLRRGIWRDDLCGAGPSAGHPLQMWVKSDADGVDNANLRDEYAVVVNRHPTRAIDVGGWLLRESSQFRQHPTEEGYRFPAGTTIAPDGFVRVRVGSGSDTATDLHLGSSVPLFDNADRSTGTDANPAAGRGSGDGVYLLDPRGNVRLAFTWPCVVDCATPLAGRLVIDHVEYDPPGVDTAANEHVRLRNVSDGRISLDGLQLRNVTVAHELRFGTYLDPGETLTVHVGVGAQSRTNQYWGQTGPILANGGDRVDLVTFDERLVDCVDWGSGRDCPWPIPTPGAGSSGALPTAPELRGAAQPALPRVFADVDPSSTHGAAIEWLVEQGITGGCGAGRYCPARPVTRAQMATFLVSALDLPPAPSRGFADLAAGATHAANVDALAQAGVTTGCGDAAFCPDEPVTRAQMATFLVAALELPPGAPRGFGDVPAGSTHAANVDALAQAGVTTGCGGGRFCPAEPVTRAQMATFLRAALRTS